MTYDRLDASELGGATQADYLISIDGDFRMLDGARVVYEEPAFPVVELARSLLQWLEKPERGDFAFESMSFEEHGVVTVRESGSGWIFSSVFTPQTASSPLGWDAAEWSVRSFISRVESDLQDLGIDPDSAFQR